MLPQVNFTLEELQQVPRLSTSHNFRLDMKNRNIGGFVDELDAIAQAIFLMLMTEKGKYEIYPEDYGLQTLDLYGKSKAYVQTVLAGRIKRCLLQDLRINDVDNFKFESIENEPTALKVIFDVDTIFGETEVEVNVSESER